MRVLLMLYSYIIKPGPYTNTTRRLFIHCTQNGQNNTIQVIKKKDLLISHETPADAKSDTLPRSFISTQWSLNVVYIFRFKHLFYCLRGLSVCAS